MRTILLLEVHLVVAIVYVWTDTRQVEHWQANVIYDVIYPVRHVQARRLLIVLLVILALCLMLIISALSTQLNHYILTHG